MIKLGLTGGICTGKTFILDIFKELGAYTIRADDIAKNIIFSNKPEIVEKIIEVFGSEVYDKKKGIKKEEFSRILFTDTEKRDFINRFIQPLMASERKKIIKEAEKSGCNIFVYESALLVESGIYKDFDAVVVVYTSEEEQIDRLLKRDGICIDDAKNRIKSQFPLNEKLKVANYAIDTTGSFENARTKILETYFLVKKDFSLI